jgi:hypothetical protein
MKLNTNSIAVAFGALLLSLAPAMANAERVYFLVGVRHVYKIGAAPDLHLAEREDIEKTYADGVASDQATYQQHVAGGADAATEKQARDGDLDELAADRDKSLGAIFELRDDVRARHPELQIQGDGPYQVMGIDFHRNANVVVFDAFTVFAPWPGYVVVGEPYGGWIYGRPYAPGIFLNLYVGWHAQFGGTRFYGGFYGHNGPIPFTHGRFAGSVASFARRGGYVHVSGVRTGGFGHAAPGGYTHSGSSRSTGSFNRSTSPSRGGSFGTRSGGYSHSSSPARDASSRGSAGSDRSATSGGHSSGYSHGSSHSSSSHSKRDHSHSGGSDRSSHSHGGSGDDHKN